jgi:MATE family multidrug resistance protein
MALVYGGAIAAGRYVIPRVYSHDGDVVKHSGDALPFVCAYMVLDAFQLVGQGVLRGAGQQQLGAWTAIVGFLAVVLPLTFVFAFVAGLRLSGLWLGMVRGPMALTAEVDLCAAFR